jgi:uncharacterized membrane protein (UPF0127 family)
MKVDTEEEEIEVETAESVLKRSLGLSFRTEGKMLFLFNRDVWFPIDMMLMRDSLYIYFLNSEKEVILSKRADPWYTFPEKFLHRPEEKYRYVLESFEDLGLEEGDRIDF